jgi:hypothetical protein
MLIAIISDTFDKVQEIREQTKLKELCKLIAENWYLVVHHKTFKRKKYVAMFQIEKAEGQNQNSSEEGRLTH